MDIDGTSRSSRTSLTPPDGGSCEDPDADTTRRQSERAAAERRDAWIEGSGAMSGADATTRESRSRSCVSSPKEARDETLAADSAKTAAHDTPLADDPVGNAIPGLVVGGAAGAVRAVGALASSIAIRGAAKSASDVAYQIAEKAGEEITANAVEHGAHSVLHHPVHDGTIGHDLPPDAEKTQAPIGPPPPLEPNSCEVRPPFVRQG